MMEELPSQRVPEKAELIQKTLDQDAKAFDLWVSRVSNRGRLDLDPSALRFLVIPSRVLDLATNPDSVKVTEYTKSEPKDLCILVVETQAKPVSDLEEIRKYQNVRYDGFAKDSFVGLDWMHKTFSEEVISGQIGLEDFIFFYVHLTIPSGSTKELHVNEVETHPGARRLGIAKSFYERLRYCSKKMGFRYITGWSRDDIGERMATGMERVKYADLDKRFAWRLKSTRNEDERENIRWDRFTVDFLYEEDKTKYVRGAKT